MQEEKAMFIIFGWNYPSSKNYGPTLPTKCPHCGNDVFYHLLHKRLWFTLFFIPVIPYESKHYLLCNICSNGYELEDEQVEKAKQLNQMTLSLIDSASAEDRSKKTLQEEVF